MESSRFQNSIILNKIYTFPEFCALFFAFTLLTYILYKFYYELIWIDPRIKKLVNEFPGPQTVPLFGNALVFNVENHEIFPGLGLWVQEYGRCFRAYIGNRPYIIIACAEDAEKFYSSTVNIDKNDDYLTLSSWLGEGLVTSNGSKWAERRKLITPAFHFKVLDEFINIFNGQCETFTQILKEQCCNGKPFDFYSYATRLTLDIICESALGRKIYAQQRRKCLPVYEKNYAQSKGGCDKESDFVLALHKVVELVTERSIRPWLRPEMIWKMSKRGREEKKCLKIVHGFTDKIIQSRKGERKEMRCNNNTTHHKIQRRAFLDLLLDIQEQNESEKIMTDKDIRDEVGTFSWAGHDTTSPTITFALFLLSCYPQYQKKVQEELDEIFEGDNRPCTMLDVSKMKFLERCIKEALRLYPAAPINMRKLREDCVLNDGRIIPKGCTAVVLLYELHRDPKYFENPEEFDPDRFLVENSKQRSPYAYAAFAAGGRNCIGQKFAMLQMKVILAHILREFTVTPAQKREDIKILPHVTIRPKGGLYVKLDKREQSVDI